jgi:hypothetical protein
MLLPLGEVFIYEGDELEGELSLTKVASRPSKLCMSRRTQVLCKNSKLSLQLLQVAFNPAFFIVEVCYTGTQAYMLTVKEIPLIYTLSTVTSVGKQCECPRDELNTVQSFKTETFIYLLI